MYSANSGIRRIVLMGTALMVAFALTGAWAQSDQEENGTKMGAGSIDVAASGGLNALIYPYIEPQLDIQLLPLGPVTLSAGATGDVGYCLFCNLLGALDADWRLQSYYFGGYARVLAHITALSEALGSAISVDPYAGLAVGPRWYVVSFQYTPTNASSRASLTSVIIAPQVGTRVFFGKSSRLFGFAEARYLIELGFQSQTVEVSGQTYTFSDDFSSAGSSVSLGLGFRL